MDSAIAGALAAPPGLQLLRLSPCWEHTLWRLEDGSTACSQQH